MLDVELGVEVLVVDEFGVEVLDVELGVEVLVVDELVVDELGGVGGGCTSYAPISAMPL